MVYSFLGEITQIFPRMDEDWVKDNTIYYEWFRNKISNGIEQGIITENLIGTWAMKRLQVLLESLEGFLFWVKYPGNTAKLKKQLAGKHTIIFGAGVRGQLILDKLDKDVLFDAYCDNNQNLWNTELKGKPVFSLDQCKQMMPDAYYLISVKNNSKEIVKQLRNKGIKSEKICLYIGDMDGIDR